MKVQGQQDKAGMYRTYRDVRDGGFIIVQDGGMNRTQVSIVQVDI